MNIQEFSSLNAAAAAAASEAFSRLARRPVEVVLEKTELIRDSEGTPSGDREQLVVGVYMPILGRLDGAALLCFPQPAADRLSTLLIEPLRETSLGRRALSESALKEVGNIVCGNYLTVLSNKLRAKTLPGVPHYANDMFGSLFQQVLAELAQEAPQELLIEVEVKFADLIARGHLVLFLKTERLLDA